MKDGFYAGRDQVVGTNPRANAFIELIETRVGTEDDTDDSGVFIEVVEEEIVAGSIRGWFSHYEAELLLKAADERDRLVIMTMAMLGLRIGKIAALRVKNSTLSSAD